MAAANATESLEPGAVASTRINDTTHLLWGCDGMEAVLYWTAAEFGQAPVPTEDGIAGGEPQIFDAAWWVVMADAPTLRVRVDGAPAWDAEATDAEQAAVIADALRFAVGHISRHRAERN